jgi:hypothetical protein
MMSNLSNRLRGHGEDSARSLPFDEVVAALGRVNEVPLGLREIPVDQIVGSVDKVRDFDPMFRPTSGRSRARWERLALAVRTGQDFPPIDVYQVGEMYFVRDGHHRVSVCRALDIAVIDADVIRVDTIAEPDDVRRRADLTPKELRRAMLTRVPLSGAERHAVVLSNPHDYPLLAEMVEAWSARTMFAEKTFIDRDLAMHRWLEEEFFPVVSIVEAAGLRRRGETDGDAFMRVSGDRYHAFLNHIWNDEVIDCLKNKQRRRDQRGLLSGNVMDMLSSDARELMSATNPTER